MSPIQPVPCGPLEVQLDCETDSVSICEIGAESASVTSVPASIVTVPLLAANPLRRGATIYNNSSAELFIKLGAGASSTSFTFRAGTNAYFEIPFNYTGEVTGIWTTANGAALVTEVLN